MRRVIPISGTDKVYFEPTIHTISKDVIDILNIKNATIKYNGVDVTDQYYSGKSVKNKSTFPTVLEVNYKIEPIQDLELSRVPVSPDSKPFYKDDEVGVEAIASYRNIRINFEFLVKSKSKTVINKLNSLMYQLKIDGGLNNYHIIRSVFLVPNLIIKTIDTIYNIKKEYNPTLTMAEYLEDTINKDSIDRFLSMDGKEINSKVAIKEYQVNTLGSFIGEFIEKEDNEKDSQYFTMPLNYHVCVDQPLAVHFKFPYLVYNRKLDESLFKVRDRSPINGTYNGYSGELALLARKHNSFGINKDYYLSYPKDDDFKIPGDVYGYSPVITILTTVDENNPTALFNINTDLSSDPIDDGVEPTTLEFKDSILNFIIENREYVGMYLGSLFYFCLYENNNIKKDMISMDELCTLVTKEPMEIKNTYRVVIYICNNVGMLGRDMIDKVYDYLERERELMSNVERNNTSLGIVSQKTQDRDRKDGVGLEIVDKNYFFDAYLSFFNVSEVEVYNILKKQSTQSTADVFFKVEFPKQGMSRLRSYHNSQIFSLFK